MVSTHACSLMSRRPGSPRSIRRSARFNPRLLVDEQATLAPRDLIDAPGFNPRLLVDEQATTVIAVARLQQLFQPTPAR